jgi:hypothetical protein
VLAVRARHARQRATQAETSFSTMSLPSSRVAHRNLEEKRSRTFRDF